MTGSCQGCHVPSRTIAGQRSSSASAFMNSDQGDRRSSRTSQALRAVSMETATKVTVQITTQCMSDPSGRRPPSMLGRIRYQRVDAQKCIFSASATRRWDQRTETWQLAEAAIPRACLPRWPPLVGRPRALPVAVVNREGCARRLKTMPLRTRCARVETRRSAREALRARKDAEISRDQPP